MFIKSIFASCLVGVFFLVPQISAAYQITTQTVQSFGNTHLYTIEFEFGFLNADAWLPLGAMATSSAMDNSLSYRIETAVGETRSVYDTYAAVLSTATVTEDNQYYVPRGQRATFTFVVLVRPVSPHVKTPVVQVTDLPLKLRKNGATEITTTYLDHEVVASYYAPQR